MPEWANEILFELKEVKNLLKDIRNPRRNRSKNRDYYDFLNEFRRRMKADADKEIYPEVVYNSRRVGVDFKGLLYDKETLNLLPMHEAFRVYEHFYTKKDEIDRLIII